MAEYRLSEQEFHALKGKLGIPESDLENYGRGEVYGYEFGTSKTKLRHFENGKDVGTYSQGYIGFGSQGREDPLGAPAEQKAAEVRHIQYDNRNGKLRPSYYIVTTNPNSIEGREVDGEIQKVKKESDASLKEALGKMNETINKLSPQILPFSSKEVLGLLDRFTKELDKVVGRLQEPETKNYYLTKEQFNKFKEQMPAGYAYGEGRNFKKDGIGYIAGGEGRKNPGDAMSGQRAAEVREKRVPNEFNPKAPPKIEGYYVSTKNPDIKNIIDRLQITSGMQTKFGELQMALQKR